MMDLTQINEATEQQKAQGLVEWGKAFTAESWTEVHEMNGCYCTLILIFVERPFSA